jgi:hypothetical protein
MGFRHIPGTLEGNGLRCINPCEIRGTAGGLVEFDTKDGVGFCKQRAGFVQ